MKMLHITDTLRKRDDLDKIIAILNLPRPNICTRRGKKVVADDGTIDYSCKGCIAGADKGGPMLSLDSIKGIIDYFKDKYGTIFTTITGKGDPFHPKLVDSSVGILDHSAKRGLIPYVFTAGDHLDDRVIKALVDSKANVMISLLGNPFIDADFFAGKTYPKITDPGFIDPHAIAGSIRKLISAYKDIPTPAGTTRIGMNYVIKPADLKDDSKVKALSMAAADHGIFLICNPYFAPDIDATTTDALAKMAKKYSHFHLTHSTGFDGRCHVGAGSSATVDYDGRLFRCPHMTDGDDGNFTDLIKTGDISKVLAKYIADRKYSCMMRKTRLT